MTENELVCKSFVDAALSWAESGSTIFITILENNKYEKDIFPKATDTIYSLISNILTDKEQTKNITEIQLKQEKDGNIKIINKIEIN